MDTLIRKVEVPANPFPSLTFYSEVRLRNQWDDIWRMPLCLLAFVSLDSLKNLFRKVTRRIMFAQQNFLNLALWTEEEIGLW